MVGSFPLSPEGSPQDLYLSLLRDVLTRYAFADEELRPMYLGGRSWRGVVLRRMQSELNRRGLRVVKPVTVTKEERSRGDDWPADAETMIGRTRLDNIRHCVERVVADAVPGDLIEAGVWRGGAAIFMRGVLAVHGIYDRTVWLADSFEGLPPPVHVGDFDSSDLSQNQMLKVGVQTVRENFERYGLLDDKIEFLVGWFKDTLPSAPLANLAVVRLDGDLYESTWDAITALYPRLSPGGFVIVDDYHSWPGCRRAIDDYRRHEAISEPIESVDEHAIYWRREL